MDQDLTPSRCSSCPTFVNEGFNRILRRWTSYDELDQSATSGCDFCAMCRLSLAHAISVDKLRQFSGEVRLYGYKDHWSLECLAFQGAIILQLSSDSKEEARESWPQINRRETLGQRRNNQFSSEPDLDIFGQVAEWLQVCLTNHRDCRNNATNLWELPELPKRLIDLSHGNNVSVFNCQDRIKTGTISPDRVKYCTLSYRWGDTPHSCVLTKPFSDSLLIPTHSMPQTFQDAMKVVRRLGIRYLWIDALCIVQPSSEDDTEWIEEGSRMGIIYQNAVFTVSATAGLRANQGFLERTGTSLFTADPVIVYREEGNTGKHKKYNIPARAPSFYESISNSPLNNRGWVVQERALSTRIIHFTVHGVFWECGSIKAHNVYGILQNRDDFPSCRSNETLLSVARTRRTRHVCPVEWFHFVKQYSYTHFTHPEDRLLALSSVAKAVQPYLGGHDYIAGLWKNDIVRGLAWKCHYPNSQPSDPTTPSWSWASAKGGIDLAVFALRMYRYDLVEVLDIAATPVSTANPFGRLIRGSVTLKGKLTYEWLRKAARMKYNHDLNVYWDDLQGLERLATHTDIASPPKPPLKRYTLLPIGKDRPPLDSKTYIGALILESTGKAEVVPADSGEILRSEFRRIGWVEYTYRHDSSNDTRKYWDERGEEEIVLI